MPQTLDDLKRLAGLPSAEVGTLFSEGVRVGKLVADAVHRGSFWKALPDPSWTRKSLSITERECPSAFEFLIGMAQGAGCSFEALFNNWYEELWDAPYRDRGCTDIAVRNPDGEVLIAHTNDTGPRAGVGRTVVEVMGRPSVSMVLSGGCPSAAANSAGLVLSGNQVDAKDTRPGIPRQVLYLEACWARSIEEARDIVLHPARASSFHNLFADVSGRVIGFEASAKKAVPLVLEDGVLIHTNHYLGIPSVEARTDDSLNSSINRYYRALDMVEFAKDTYGEVTKEALVRTMRSHGQGGLCRHGDIETGFSCIFLPQSKLFYYGEGTPCSTRYVEVPY